MFSCKDTVVNVQYKTGAPLFTLQLLLFSPKLFNFVFPFSHVESYR
jgi:hypothetical protein